MSDSPEQAAAILNEIRDGWCTSMGVRFVRASADEVVAEIEVSPQHLQAYGIVHGGANVLLAETLGSIASSLVMDVTKSICVGLEINANHVRAIRKGRVKGVCRPIHLGRTTHLWEIRIEDEEGRLSCISRLTMAILPKE